MFFCRAVFAFIYFVLINYTLCATDSFPSCEELPSQEYHLFVQKLNEKRDAQTPKLPALDITTELTKVAFHHTSNLGCGKAWDKNSSKCPRDPIYAWFGCANNNAACDQCNVKANTPVHECKAEPRAATDHFITQKTILTEAYSGLQDELVLKHSADLSRSSVDDFVTQFKEYLTTASAQARPFLSARTAYLGVAYSGKYVAIYTGNTEGAIKCVGGGPSETPAWVEFLYPKSLAVMPTPPDTCTAGQGVEEKIIRAINAERVKLQKQPATRSGSLFHLAHYKSLNVARDCPDATASTPSATICGVDSRSWKGGEECYPEGSSVADTCCNMDAATPCLDGKFALFNSNAKNAEKENFKVIAGRRRENESGADLATRLLLSDDRDSLFTKDFAKVGVYISDDHYSVWFSKANVEPASECVYVPRTTSEPTAPEDRSPTPKVTKCQGLMGPAVRAAVEKINELRGAAKVSTVVAGDAMMKHSHYHVKNAKCTNGEYPSTQKCSPSLKSWVSKDDDSCKFPSGGELSCCNDGKNYNSNCLKEAFFVPDIGKYKGSADIVSVELPITQSGTSQLDNALKNSLKLLFESGGPDGSLLRSETFGFVGAWSKGMYTTFVLGNVAAAECPIAPAADARVLDVNITAPKSCSAYSTDEFGVVYDLVKLVNGMRSSPLVLTQELFNAAYFHVESRLCGGTVVPDKEKESPCAGVSGWKTTHCYPAGLTDSEVRAGCCPYAEGDVMCNTTTITKSLVSGWDGTAREEVYQISSAGSDNTELLKMIEHVSTREGNIILDPDVEEIGVAIETVGDYKMVSVVGGKSVGKVVKCIPDPTEAPKPDTTSSSSRLYYGLAALCFFALF